MAQASASSNRHSIAASPDSEFSYHVETFQVADVLFTIPVHFVDHSPYFQELMGYPAKDHRDSGASVFVIDIEEDVTPAEFRDFLRVVMAAPYQIKGRIAADPTSWVHVMKLATVWGLPEIRAIAAVQIGKHAECVTRLAVARRYDVKELLPGALEDVFKRDRPLEYAECAELGFELGVGLMKYREERRRPRELGGAFSFEEYNCALIEKVFGAAFAEDVRAGLQMRGARSAHTASASSSS